MPKQKLWSVSGTFGTSDPSGEGSRAAQAARSEIWDGCCRLVFHCLLELCRCQAKGIVEHAVLLGTPVGVTPQRWRMARTVVAGRLVNGYSTQDWVRTSPLPGSPLRICARGACSIACSKSPHLAQETACTEGGCVFTQCVRGCP